MKVRAIGREVRDRKLTYLSPKKLRSLLNAVDAVTLAEVPGDFLEFGVALGGSGICLASRLEPGRRYLGFDVFGMIPPPTEADGEAVGRRYRTIAEGRSEGIGGGQYYGYVDDLHAKVSDSFAALGLPVDGERILLVKGLFEQTVVQHGDATVALAHIDCDWYEVGPLLPGLRLAPPVPGRPGRARRLRSLGRRPQGHRRVPRRARRCAHPAAPAAGDPRQAVLLIRHGATGTHGAPRRHAL